MDSKKHQERLRYRTEKNILRGPKCWLWTGLKDKNGYGVVRIKDRNYRAHRVVYEFLVGPIPKNMFICHHCDNPSCVRPEHLFAGTPNDNVQDMMKKGRYKAGGRPHPGEKNGRAILTEKDVHKIRKLCLKMPASEICNIYGVEKTTILNIIKGKSWKHLKLKPLKIPDFNKILKSKPVFLMNKKGKILKKFKSAKDAEIYFCLSNGIVSRMCNKRVVNPRHGYIFIWG